jgi:hypothetical protein
VNFEVVLKLGRLIARPIRFVLVWSPVWIPCVLIWQFSTRGLQPSQAEQARLEQETPRVLERYEEERADFEVMAAEAEAWTDPVFRERRRRLRATAREANAPLPAEEEADQQGR